MGIIEGGSLLIDEKCGVPENNFFFTIATTVPGKVLNWIKGLDYPEINECLTQALGLKIKITQNKNGVQWVLILQFKNDCCIKTRIQFF